MTRLYLIATPIGGLQTGCGGTPYVLLEVVPIVQHHFFIHITSTSHCCHLNIIELLERNYEEWGQ